jgi:SlyX protein
MDDESLEQIQTKIAYLEHANSELSDVVSRQDRELRALHAQVAVLFERVRSLQTPDRVRGPDEERPPHY